MARPREFDESHALDAAMQCFWRRGYEATSLRDLMRAMGLTAPSLYNSFGDKQKLFVRTLERYLDHTTRDRLRRLEQTLPPRRALECFFAEIIEHSLKDKERKGCFLVNSALEIAPHDVRCRAMIAAQFTGIEAFFRRCVAAAQRDGTASKRRGAAVSLSPARHTGHGANQSRAENSRRAGEASLGFTWQAATKQEAQAMIDLYYWTTPNGHKITIFLEEAGLSYRIVPVNISKGEQFRPEFLAISPNNRMPAIVDQKPKDGGKPISVFESGAILLYLSEKTGKYIPEGQRNRVEVIEWLFWQMGGLGPMAGQNHHFAHYAPEKIPYAIERYVKETNRLYGVLNKRLANREFVAGRYSIADMAIYPWIVPYERQGQKLDEFPDLKRWFLAVGERPAVHRAYARAKEINTQPTVSEESKKILFGQTAAVAR